MNNTPENLYESGQLVLKKLTEYIKSSRAGKGKVLTLKPILQLAKELNLEGLIRSGGLDHSMLDEFLNTYFENTQHLHHPGYIGHQVAVPHIAGGLADFIHGISNNPVAIYEMGPAGASMELVVLNWMIEKIGWTKSNALDQIFDDPEKPAGVMTHGGSLANLTAMLAARAHIAPDAWENGNPSELVVLAPSASHYSIGRAISIIGLGKKAIVEIPVDHQERIIFDKIPEIIAQQQSKGKQIMALVANGCATSTGYFDDIESIGKICQNAKIWFHVDAPHGATALVSEKHRHLMKGIEYADSLIWDAHKMMKTSALGTGVLFKKQKHMAAAFRQKGSYIFHDKKQPGIDFIHFTVECTKSGLGMKLFWVLAAMGEKGMGNYIDTLFKNTLDFYHLFQEEEDFECFGQPESNILCFQYKGKEIDQLKIRSQLVENGNFYITTTEINEERYLRLTVMNEQTSLTTIKNLILEIKSIGG